MALTAREVNKICLSGVSIELADRWQGELDVDFYEEVLKMPMDFNYCWQSVGSDAVVLAMMAYTHGCTVDDIIGSVDMRDEYGDPVAWALSETMQIGVTLAERMIYRFLESRGIPVEEFLRFKFRFLGCETMESEEIEEFEPNQSAPPSEPHSLQAG